MQITRKLPDEHATAAIGAKLAKVIEPGMVIHLCGELGSGKTALARAMLRSCGVSGRIKSPTYTLVEVYTVSKLNFYHFDFYRFDNPDEWLSAGFREHFRADTVCLVEWPEKAGVDLPAPDIRIRLSYDGDGARALEISASTERGRRCLGHLDL